MKRAMIVTFALAALMACNKEKTNLNNNNTTGTSGTDTPCGDHKSQQTYREPDGDCYLMENGSKKYVDRHECDC